MKTIGLLGGMSWESTIPYYRLINEGIKQQLGGLHSASLLLHSVDFHDIEVCQRRGEWDKAGDILAQAAQGLQQAGAEGIVLCTNTMHKIAHVIESRCSLPFLHIADATGRAIARQGLHRVALLGTRYTMEQDFIAGGWNSNLRLRPSCRRRTIGRVSIRSFLTSSARGHSLTRRATIIYRLSNNWLRKARRALFLAALK